MGVYFGVCCESSLGLTKPAEGASKTSESILPLIHYFIFLPQLPIHLSNLCTPRDHV